MGDRGEEDLILKSSNHWGKLGEKVYIIKWMDVQIGVMIMVTIRKEGGI